MMLPTTTVGSFPKPDYLAKARALFRGKKISPSELDEQEKKATREIIALQEDVGLDILVHGEMERGDMVTYFAERFEGFSISGPVRSYGNRYYRKPIVGGAVTRPQPVSVAMYEFAQSLTERPIKGMLTGPYTMCDWSFNTHYTDRRSLTLAMAELIAQEARDLDMAGCEYIQIDEPAISTRPEELPIAVEAMGIVTSGLKAKTISHICYGDFKTIYPDILKLPVDQLDLEFANSEFTNLEIFADPPFTKEIAVGVIDIHTQRIETVEQVKDWIRSALDVFDPEKVTIDPDCGLKTRTIDEARDKLKVMVRAVREIRAEKGWT
jgi:5-methyltetrahydropteroyltriglutamate--homocysteine methyltransferase